MKQLLFLIIWSVFGVNTTPQKTDIIGIWQNEAGNRKITFYESFGGLIEGKVLEDEDPSIKNKIVFSKIKLNGKIYGGTAFLPKRNKYINCTLKLTSPNTLAITGKIGFMNDTKIWKRIK